MAKLNPKKRLSRRRFMQAVAAAAVSGASLPLAAREREDEDEHERGRRDCSDARDLNLVNGRFLTIDARNSVASAVAIRDGRIVRVGHPADLGPCGLTLNLRGASVIPGLIDSHVHYIRCGLNPGHEVRIIETATSIGEIQSMIAARIRELAVPAGDFITCVGGWNINGLAEKRLPTLTELDTAAPQHGVYLSTTGTGGAVTNSVGKAFFNSRGVAVNGDGTLSSGAAFAALQLAQTDASKLQGTSEAMDFAASLGMTMFHDHGGLSGLQPYSYALSLWRSGQLKVRVRPWFWSGDDGGISVAETRVVNDFNRVGDDVWRQLGIGERINTSTTNPLNAEAWKFAAQQGWMVTQHSSTAAEIAFHISAYQAAADAGPIPIGALRWSLCHVNAISDAQIAAVKALGIGLNIQGTSYTSNPGAAPSGPPFRKLLDAGIPCGGGSDATNVAAFNPWLMMSYMTTAKNNAGAVTNGDQTITRLEALRMYTLGSAYLSWDDAKLGSIEEGKLADLAVLSDDPLAVSDDRFKRIHSVLTLQAGKVVYQASA